MKNYIKWNLLLILLPLLGCADPFNDAIKAFKNSKEPKVTDALDCVGSDGSIKFKQRTFYKYDEVNKKNIPKPGFEMIITKSINGKSSQMIFYYSYNPDNFYFNFIDYEFKNFDADPKIQYDLFCQGYIKKENKQFDITTFFARIFTLFADKKIDDLSNHLASEGWKRRNEIRNHPILGDNIPHAIFTNDNINFKIIAIYNENDDIRTINWDIK